jgi:hypothetical protein
LQSFLTFCQTRLTVCQTCICRTLKVRQQALECGKEANICKNFNPILTFAPGTRRRTNHHSVAGFVFKSSGFDTGAVFFNI